MKRSLEEESDVEESPNPKKKKKITQEDNSSSESDSEDKKSSKKKSSKTQQKKEKKIIEKKRNFTKEIKTMMFGFGEVSNPISETVDLIEDLVVQYVHDMSIKALQTSQKRGKLTTEDFVHAVRNDPKKHARAQELLKLEEEIRIARKAFEDK